MKVDLRPGQLVIGVDTHQQDHHAVALDHAGGWVAGREFPATASGYRALLSWARGLGTPAVFGVESTGSYGAGLARFLLVEGILVLEVNRPDKTTRARDGKSDPIDAEAAARAVLAGRAAGLPKVTAGVIESIRQLKIVHDSAVKARTVAFNQVRDVVTTAPDTVREQLLPLTNRQRVARAVRFRIDPARLADPAHAARFALQQLATRIRDLDTQINTLKTRLDALVADALPSLIALPRVGTLTAAQLAITAGENLDRFDSEPRFAKLVGTAPIPASSGKTHRHRLNRGGDRQANKALHLIAVGRMNDHPATRHYVTRRTLEGLSKKDIIRCLKRAITRETYRALRHDLLTT